MVFEPDEVAGQLFIKSHEIRSQGAQSATKDPLYLTLITEGGLVQDLKLIPHDVEAQTLILKSSSGAEECSDLSPEDNLRANSLEIIERLMGGGGETVPLYQTRPRTPPRESPRTRPRTSPHTDIVLREEKKLRQGVLMGATFEAVNQGQQDVVLREALFARPGDVALCFEYITLKPGAKTKAYIVSKEAPQ
jgi:hypothetical protein